MFRRTWSFSLALLFLILLPSCSSVQTRPVPEANMPNPASVFCEQHGGRLELKQDDSGGVLGMCIFPDGSECDEWAFFRSECKPGDKFGEPDPTATPVATDTAWKIYHNEGFGYRFAYPADAKIVMNDNPLKGLSIIGREKDGEIWPSISISHPRDLESFHVPVGSDLLQWLTDHNLLGENQKPDLQIAGTVAFHFRHERSPQSYAFDQYYFSIKEQLFQVIIGHAGDKEDWELYNHFLQSIQFE